ncbi:MAG: hypothetical protein R3330_09350, partial [Saprospiraceae bacterium]|nr:hypothetical protein [Saprospiraceae bacterium]
YNIQINRNAPDFENRFLGSTEIDVNKKFWEKIQPVEQEIGYGEITQGEFYKAYPYFFSQLLSELKPELSVKGGIVRLKEASELSQKSRLTFDRCIAIFELHYQLMTFLKFGAMSILWTLHNRKLLDLKQLAADQKKLIQDNLTHHYSSPMVDASRVTAIEEIFSLIPFDQIQDSEAVRREEASVWLKMRDLISDQSDMHRQMAELVHSFASTEAQDNKANWLRAEDYLIEFVTNEAFRFLRHLEIWSIYDIYYRQFRYRDEKELVFKRGVFPIATRPTEGKSDEDVMTLRPEDPIDYDVQSVYLVENNTRVLNLTPFYVDMFAADENADKMDICYLEAYRERMKLHYISIMDRETWHQVGEARSDNEQKFIYDQITYFWKLIAQ